MNMLKIGDFVPNNKFIDNGKYQNRFRKYIYFIRKRK